MSQEIPKFKTIKIKIDNNHSLDINDKGVLTISVCKKEKKDIDINKINKTIQNIKSNFTEGKKRGRKAKITDPIINELIEEAKEVEEVEPVRVYKKRGRKAKITDPIINELIEEAVELPMQLEPIKVHKKRGPKPKLREKIEIPKKPRGRPKKLNLDIPES